VSTNKKNGKAANERFLLTIEVTKKEKSNKAKYLTKRINDLYDNISDWIKDLKDYTIKRTTVTVDGEKLPALDILAGKKSIVTLKPTGLWAFGVNCQIEMVSEKEKNILVDIAKESKPAEWQLIGFEAGKKSKKLAKVIFRNLLRRINN
jgi:hypothetical protein